MEWGGQNCLPMPIFFLTMLPDSKTTASRMPKMAKAPPTMAHRLMRNSESGWWVAVMRTWMGEEGGGGRGGEEREVSRER